MAKKKKPFIESVKSESAKQLVVGLFLFGVFSYTQSITTSEQGKDIESLKQAQSDIQEDYNKGIHANEHRIQALFDNYVTVFADVAVIKDRTKNL